MKLVVFLAFVIPFSIFCWILNILFHFYKTDSEPVSPVRFLIAVWAPVLVAQWGLTRKSLDRSGALAGLLIGFLMTISNLCFFSSLLTFFVMGSKVTKYKAKEKRKIEENFKEGGQHNWMQVFCNGGIAAEFCLLYLIIPPAFMPRGGQRNWMQVFCNSGIAAEFCLLYFIEAGCRETLIDFTGHYMQSWFCIATLGALCCACGDTFSSEIGSVFGSGKYARLITNFKKVPRGTNGAVSLAGTLASIVGGALVGLAYYITLLLTCNEYYLEDSPPQWLLIPVGGALGLLGSSVDSFLGATFQYSGYDRKHDCIVGYPGPDIEHICGSDNFDNHGVNLISSFITALLAPRVAHYAWHM